MADIVAQGAVKCALDERLNFAMDTFNPERRFGGMARLYGGPAFARLAAAHVCVVGVGGVGSWAAEALARSGVGQLTLIDLDNVAESNVNRQVHALDGAFGKPKVRAMAERIALIHPGCVVHEIEDFVTLENAADLMARGYTCVIDAIDNVRVKAALIAQCRAQSLPVVTAGAAGGQTDPTRIRLDDLARTTQDPLLAKVRARLRKEYGFTRDVKKKFGVAAVYSEEPIRAPQSEGVSCDVPANPLAHGLNCAGYGSSMAVTASFAMVAVSWALSCCAQSESSARR